MKSAVARLQMMHTLTSTQCGCRPVSGLVCITQKTQQKVISKWGHVT